MKKMSLRLNTIRAKMVAVTLALVLVLVAMVAFFSANTYRNYRRMQIAQCQNLVDVENERTNIAIHQLQNNARELALIGELFYEFSNHSPAFGRYAVMRNFNINSTAVGGGIWFEPYLLGEDTQRVCFYAFNDGSRVVFDESFESAEYDYPTQDWYVGTKAAEERGEKLYWTPPYIDDTGTMSLMTTVGCPIYDEIGAFIGMSTVDWQLDSIAQRVAEIRPTENSFVLFADQTNDFVLALSQAGATGEVVGASLDTIPWLAGALDGDGGFDYGGVHYLAFTTTLDNGMLLVVNVPERELFSDINRSMATMVVVLVCASVVILAVMYWLLNRFINKPVALLSARAAQLGRGDLDTRIELDTKDELGQLAQTFNAMAGSIKEYIANLNAVTAEKERIGAELNVATEIQASMLPSIFPAFPERDEFDIYATMVPAKEVGGDFYDFFLVDEAHLAVVIADVSGKGVPAALFMVIAKTLIKNQAQLGDGAGEVFTRVNDQLCENNEVGMFVTAFMGILNIHTGEFTYANAGHNPPLLCRAGGEYEWLQVKPGFILAGLEGVNYQQGALTLEKGDALFMYTDGVTEAENEERELFGEPRLLEAVNACRAQPLAGLLAGVKREIDAFAGDAPQFDDITMLGLVYGSKPE